MRAPRRRRREAASTGPSSPGEAGSGGGVGFISEIQAAVTESYAVRHIHSLTVLVKLFEIQAAVAASYVDWWGRQEAEQSATKYWSNTGQIDDCVSDTL